MVMVPSHANKSIPINRALRCQAVRYSGGTMEKVKYTKQSKNETGRGVHAMKMLVFPEKSV